MISANLQLWLRKTADQFMQDECDVIRRLPGVTRDSRGRVIHTWGPGVRTACYTLTPDPSETADEVRLTQVRVLVPLGTVITHVDRVQLVSQPGVLYAVVGEITQRVDHLVVNLSRLTEA